MLGLLLVPDRLSSICLLHRGYSFLGLPWHPAGGPCWPKANSASLAAFIYKPIDSATVLESSLESSSLRPWTELLYTGKLSCWSELSWCIGISAFFPPLSLQFGAGTLDALLAFTMSNRTSLFIRAPCSSVVQHCSIDPGIWAHLFCLSVPS